MSENRDDTDPEITELKAVTRNEEWGPEAFRDAGETTFGDRVDEQLDDVT